MPSIPRPAATPPSDGAATATAVPAKPAVTPPTAPKPAAPANGKAPAETKPAKPNRVADEKFEQINEIKTRIHRKLVDKLDLGSVSAEDEDLRERVKELVT